MYNVGRAYENGKGGLAADPVQAVVWYRKAADQGNPLAQFSLGQMMVSKPAEAYFWLSLATNHLDGDSLLKANVLRDDAAARLKPADKVQADDRISQWNQLKRAGINRRNAAHNHAVAAHYKPLRIAHGFRTLSGR